MTAPLVRTGDRATTLARACNAPDPHRVVRVEIGGDGGGNTRFVYDDGREWVLLGIMEVER